jgi:hypothetical protein
MDISDRNHVCDVLLIFLLALADSLCCAWFIYPILYWCWCPEIGTSSIDWAQLSRFHLKTETESSLRNVVLVKYRMMDNVQKHNNSINIPWAQTFRFYLQRSIFLTILVPKITKSEHISDLIKFNLSLRLQT